MPRVRLKVTYVMLLWAMEGKETALLGVFKRWEESKENTHSTLTTEYGRKEETLMEEYCEVHIIPSDGNPWCGHTGSTKEEAIKAAEEALSSFSQDYPQLKALRMEVFECHLVETIELNP